METDDRTEKLRLRVQYKRFLPGTPLPWERNPMIVRRALELLLSEQTIETLNLYPFDRLREQIVQIWEPFDEEILINQIDFDHPEWVMPPATGEDGSDRMEPFWRAYEERLSTIEEFESRSIDAATQRLQAVIAKRAAIRRKQNEPPSKGSKSQFRRDRPAFDWFIS